MQEMETLPLDFVVSETDALRRETRYRQAKTLLLLVVSSAVLTFWSPPRYMEPAPGFSTILILPGMLNAAAWMLWVLFANHFFDLLLARGMRPPRDELDTPAFYQRYQAATYALRRLRPPELVIETACAAQFIAMAFLRAAPW